MFFTSCCFFRLVGVDADARTIKVNTSPKSDFVVELNCSTHFPFDRLNSLLDKGILIIPFNIRQNYYQPKKNGNGRYSMPLVVGIFDNDSVNVGSFGWGD